MKRFNAKQAAMKALRAEGWPLVFNVEERRGPLTFDLLGCLDCLAYHPHRGWLGLQVTTSDNMQAHIEKIALNDKIRDLWVGFGFGFELWLYPSAAEREQGEDTPERFDMAKFIMGGEITPVPGLPEMALDKKVVKGAG